MNIEHSWLQSTGARRRDGALQLALCRLALVTCLCCFLLSVPVVTRRPAGGAVLLSHQTPQLQSSPARQPLNELSALPLPPPQQPLSYPLPPQPTGALAAPPAPQQPCQAPSLPAGAFHVVLAGYEVDTCFSYLFDLGLTNARVFVYRRAGAGALAARTWQGRCGVQVAEALLLPNRGRDGSAFYDYVAANYAALPEAVVFLHGHGPFETIYTDGPTVASRVVAYYRAVARGEPIAGHQVTLTKRSPTGAFEGWWNVRRATRRLAAWPHFPLVPDGDDSECAAILDRHGAVAASPFLQSCCASFILPGAKLRMHPRQMYAELRQRLLAAEDDKKAGYACFEYTVVRLFNESSIASQPDVLAWYEGVPHVELQRHC